jgi:hypothetical protein
MERLKTLVLTIGLNELLNCILVNNDVRPAMLIQPADYQEATYKDPKTAAKLQAIKKQFPDLIQSIVEGGEIIISKREIKPETIKENGTMGEILGYPCHADYQYTLDNKDELKVAIEIIVHLKPGFDTDTTQIIAYICKDERFFAESKIFAKKCAKALKADPLGSLVITSVSAEKRVIMPIKYLINKLIRGEAISTSEKEEIINQIWNLGFSEEMGGKIVAIKYQFENPIHRGMLISLLSLCDNNQMEPFWPLQYRKEQAEVDTISEKWASELIRLFEATAIKNSAGRKKTHRKKHTI